MAAERAADRTETVGAAGIFLAFLRLGLTAFGGPAMVAYIRDLAVKKRRWLSDESFHHGVGVCQSIPGATAMQAAAYVGLRARGPLGAAAAYVGFGLPAFVLMVAMSAVYLRAHDVAAVVALFKGLQVIVVALVANATLGFGRSSVKGWQDGLLAVGAAAILIRGGNPVLAIVASAALGLVLYRETKEGAGEGAASERGGLLGNLAAPLVLLLGVTGGLLVLHFLDHKLFDLSALMLKVDLFAFGGGYASVPLMFHEVTGVRHWMDSKTFMDGIALGQVTPGPIVITATFVGYLIAGLPGALVGTVAVFSPSLIILTAVVPYFDRFRSNVLFQRGLRGALASFVGLLLAVTVRFSLAIHWNVPEALLTVAAFTALRLKVDILWVVLAGAVLSALLL